MPMLIVFAKGKMSRLKTYYIERQILTSAKYFFEPPNTHKRQILFWAAKYSQPGSMKGCVHF